MSIVRSIYEFITGGSVAAPVLLAVAVIVTLIVPAGRPVAFFALVAAAFVAAAYERPQ